MFLNYNKRKYNKNRFTISEFQKFTLEESSAVRYKFRDQWFDHIKGIFNNVIFDYLTKL